MKTVTPIFSYSCCCLKGQKLSKNSVLILKGLCGEKNKNLTFCYSAILVRVGDEHTSNLVSFFYYV